MPDRGKVIEGLECCIKTGDKDCPRVCTFYNVCFPRTEHGCTAFFPVMRAALELLKEQPDIVRCKDCKHYGYHNMTNVDGFCYCLKRHEYPHPDWFCADGKRR